MKKTMSKKNNGFAKFLFGAGVGAGLAALFTTKKGKEYQKTSSDYCEELINKAKNIEVEEVRDNIESKVNEIKLELVDLDKEKALKIAQKKAEQIQQKANQLVDYAVEKGTPV